MLSITAVSLSLALHCLPALGQVDDNIKSFHSVLLKLPAHFCLPEKQVVIEDLSCCAERHNEFARLREPMP